MYNHLLIPSLTCHIINESKTDYTVLQHEQKSKTVKSKTQFYTKEDFGIFWKPSAEFHSRFSLTAVKDGTRQLAFANTCRNNYVNKETAENVLTSIQKNNTPQVLSQLMGDNLEVTEVKCYPCGDATRTIF